MIEIKFIRDKKKYIALIDRANKRDAIIELEAYAGGNIKIKKIKNKYCYENKIILK